VIGQSLEAMRAIGIPVYLLPGNHDPLDASSVYTGALFTAECPDNVVVLDRAGVHEIRPAIQVVTDRATNHPAGSFTTRFWYGSAT
jgi:DNA repair exonuclease SbcCD nuclease subunit